MTRRGEGSRGTGQTFQNDALARQGGEGLIMGLYISSFLWHLLLLLGEGAGLDPPEAYKLLFPDPRTGLRGS